MLRTGVGVVGPCGRHGGRLVGVKAKSWEVASCCTKHTFTVDAGTKQLASVKGSACIAAAALYVIANFSAGCLWF